MSAINVDGIQGWQGEIFGVTTPEVMLKKLTEEIAECGAAVEFMRQDERHPTGCGDSQILYHRQIASEIADIAIVLIGLAGSVGMDGAALNAAIEAKMAINRGRSWASDDHGVFSHVSRPNALDNPPRVPEVLKSGTSTPSVAPSRAFREWQALCDNAERRGVPPDEVDMCEMVEPVPVSVYQADVINAHLDMMGERVAQRVRIDAHSADMSGVHEAATKLLRDAGYTVTKGANDA